MGAKRFQFLGFLFYLLSSCVCSMELTENFDSESAIVEWSTKEFFGGVERYSFTNSNRTLLVVLGMPTSGIPTSQVYIYQKLGVKYKLVAFRNTVPGIAKVNSDQLAVSVAVKGVTILGLSWDSVVIPGAEL